MVERSPFPGMDPYIEAHWNDVHTSLITFTRMQLNPQLPPGLKARGNERLVLRERQASDSSYGYPDVMVVERVAGQRETAATAGGATTVTEPVILRATEDYEPERWVEIIDTRAGGRVVTVLEFLSATNKTPGHGARQYRKKQDDYLDGGVSLVEVDLLRAGSWVVACSEHTVPRPLASPYKAVVRRAVRLHEVEYYPISLRSALPTIKVPLRPADADAALNLRSLVDGAFAGGTFDEYLYEEELEPPLSPDDAAWADQVLRDAGLHRGA